MASPNTVAMQYIVLFSHRTVRLPATIGGGMRNCPLKEEKIEEEGYKKFMAPPRAPSFTKGIKKNTGCCSCASPLTVGRVIPVARAGGVEPGPVLLHDDARDDVFERLVEARQPLQTHLHHARSPLTNLAKEGGKKLEHHGFRQKG